MAEAGRVIVGGLAAGFRDALWGLGAVAKLDSRLNGDESLSKKVVEDIQAFTVLALRRNESNSNDSKGIKGSGAGARDKGEKPKIVQRLMQCCLLNGGVFLLSLVLFHYALLPLLHLCLGVLFRGHVSSIWSWLQPLLSYTFGLLWVLPVFLLSKVVNCFWFQDIADQAYRHFRGRPQALTSISRIVADNLFSLFVQALFLIQSQLVCLLPISPLGQLIGFLHLSLLYSLYTFEYKWYNMGWELHHRLHTLEENWPYFVGFGMPLALVTSVPESNLISGCLFSILFPLFIISGHEALPVAPTIPGGRGLNLKLFSPSVWASNILFHKFIHNPSLAPASTQTQTRAPNSSRNREHRKLKSSSHTSPSTSTRQLRSSGGSN